jgi:hypothetical protein
MFVAWFLVLVLASTRAAAQAPSQERRPVVRFSHEWIQSGGKLSSGSGAAFVCALVWPDGEFHLERKIPTAFSTAVLSAEETVHEGKLSADQISRLQQLLSDSEVTEFKNAAEPKAYTTTWRFDIFRGKGFQTIQIYQGQKDPKSVEELKSFLNQMEKHRPPVVKGAALTNCNLPKPQKPENP